MTTAVRKYVSIDFIKSLKENGQSADQIVKQCETLKRRIKNPPPPPGSISIGAASREYDIHVSTIWRWVDKGLIPVVLRTKRYKYIDKSTLSKLVEKYKVDPGQGKRTINDALDENH